LLALTVAGVVDISDVLGVEGHETKAVGQELVGEDGGVRFDFDEIDGHDWDFGENDAAEGVGEGEIDVGELEVDLEVVCLELRISSCGAKTTDTIVDIHLRS